MCQICRKFKKGSLTIDDAREELQEQSEYLTEEHIEEIEEMLFEAEDTYDYIRERKASLESLGNNYDDEEVFGETDFPDFNDGYDIQEDE